MNAPNEKAKRKWMQRERQGKKRLEQTLPELPVFRTLCIRSMAWYCNSDGKRVGWSKVKRTAYANAFARWDAADKAAFKYHCRNYVG